jgi:hypothetical protein
MFSFLASYNQARMQSKQYKAQSAVFRKNAQGTRNHARTQAYTIEEAARQNQRIEADNLTAARANQRAKVGQVKAARAGSGFTSEGTGSQAEENAQDQLDKYIANMAMSASIAMSNAFQTAQSTRLQGEIEARKQEDQAEIYSMQAKATRNAANISLATGILGSAFGAYMSYNAAEEFNSELMASDAALTNAWDRGEISYTQMQQGLAYNATLQQNPWQSAALGGMMLGDMSYHLTSGFSPFIASFSADANARKNNWGGMLSVISGNVPYKVPAAGTIFSSYL